MTTPIISLANRQTNSLIPEQSPNSLAQIAKSMRSSDGTQQVMNEAEEKYLQDFLKGIIHRSIVMETIKQTTKNSEKIRESSREYGA